MSSSPGGRPDYHDPLAGFGGAPPAQSALTLRLVLAAFGLAFCGGAAVIAGAEGTPVLSVALAVFALIAVVDIVVILRRKRRGEPG
jgi:membrane protein implicated in regulation of membrane protease activity